MAGILAELNNKLASAVGFIVDGVGAEDLRSIGFDFTGALNQGAKGGTRPPEPPS